MCYWKYAYIFRLGIGVNFSEEILLLGNLPGFLCEIFRNYFKSDQKINKKTSFFNWKYGATLKLKRTEIITHMRKLLPPQRLFGVGPSSNFSSLCYSLNFVPTLEGDFWNIRFISLEQKEYFLKVKKTNFKEKL